MADICEAAEVSDGPHKSLNMRRGWKRLAERAANAAFDVREVVDAQGNGGASSSLSGRIRSWRSGLTEDTDMALTHIESVDVGARLRGAREAAGLTQSDVATGLRVARTTLVAMEQGRRRVRIDELQSLARLYGTSVNVLLRREAVHVDLVPRFRKLWAAKDESMERAARLMTDLVRAEVELENLLGISRARNYPRARPLLPGDVRLQAENDAIDVRQWLGLGLAPVRDVKSLLELDLGVRLHVRPLDSQVSGLFAYDEAVGACMLLNANHPAARQAQTAVHELGHLTSHRQTPDVCRSEGQNDSRAERYADAFARAFLTPVRTVALKFADITAGASRITRRHVILLAHVFGVSREAMVRRLEEIRLVKPGTWDWFAANGGITNDQEREVLGEQGAREAGAPDAQRPVPLRLGLLAAEAERRELLSEGQLARLLRLDRVELRRILDAAVDESDTDGPPKLPR